MRKTFRYRLLANKQVLERADEWLGLCCNLYNVALEQRLVVYRQNKAQISRYDQINQLPELRAAYPEYSGIIAQVLQEVVERVDRAYAAFFRRVNKHNRKVGFPRFRSRARCDSFTLKQNSWKLEGNHLSIWRLGRFKLRLSRGIQGQIKTITIRKAVGNTWYACFSCDNVPERRLPPLSNIVGIDVGVKSFLVDSDGRAVTNPAYLRRADNLLRHRQRKLCRRIVGSQRRVKARLLVAKAHDKVVNQRLDFLHKLANTYVQNYGTIVFEHLHIENLVHNHRLAASISDCAWGTFIGLCTYKAEEAGRELIRIPAFEPTSKRCSSCGAINEDLTLSDRQWVCRSCGVLHDRDFNAAKNILRVGQTLQEQTYGSSQSVS